MKEWVLSYCAVCDGFSTEAKMLQFKAQVRMQFHEAKELLPIAGSVTIAQMAKEPTDDIPADFKVITNL